jgi:hypothetical protein
VSKITKSAIIVSTGLALLIGSSALAQEAAKHGPNAAFINVVFVSYHNGKAGEAYSIINDHFVPAGMAAGLPGPVAIHFDSGAWDAAYHWRLEDGYESLEWRVHPNDVAFRKALIEQEGSEEAADEIIARYESLIARTNNVIGHRHLPDEDSDSE